MVTTVGDFLIDHLYGWCVRGMFTCPSNGMIEVLRTLVRADGTISPYRITCQASPAPVIIRAKRWRTLTIDGKLPFSSRSRKEEPIIPIPTHEQNDYLTR
jgi:hypothetical protein